MEFSSLLFLFLFLPLFLMFFLLLKPEAHNGFLLLASLLFYTWGEAGYVLLLLISILVNYLLGLWVDKLETARLRKIVFITAVILNLLPLIWYKYTWFILDNLGLSTASAPSHLPLGISFFTFQALSFIVDIYRRTVAMDRNPLRFSLYMAYFPKLITGPITPYHNLSLQIASRPGITTEDFSEGCKRLIFGLGKKVLIADTLAVTANHVFAVPASEQTMSLSWLGILCYTLQIYYDFSGYSDIAIGLGRMSGFKLPENFNYPYLAKSIKEFWRRWHISLANWLRDYLFLPIAYRVSAKIKSKRLLGIKAENWCYFISAFITFLLCGIWHGAAWTFFLWGAWYGLLLIVEHAGLGKKMKRKWKQPFPWLYCQLMVMIGWVFFRSPDLGYAFDYLKAMAGFGTGAGEKYYALLYMNTRVAAFIIIGMLGTFPLFPTLKKWHAQHMERITSGSISNPLVRFIAGAGYAVIYNLYLGFIMVYCAASLAGGTYNPFIYFRF